MANDLKISVKIRSETIENDKGTIKIKVFATVGKHAEVLVGTITGNRKELAGEPIDANWLKLPT